MPTADPIENPGALPEESLTRDEIHARCRAREPFRTPQLWGARMTYWAYAVGSSATVNDDGQDRLLAVVNWQGDAIACSPTAHLTSILAMFAEPEGANR